MVAAKCNASANVRELQLTVLESKARIGKDWTPKGKEMKRLWTVRFCNCGGFIYCDKCELPCEHDRLCPECHGYDWKPERVRDIIDLLIAKDVGWLYRTKREAFASIEYDSLA